MIIVSNSEMQTYLEGKQFAKTLSGGEVVLLGGHLGAGKTVFAKGVAAGLNIKHAVVSPTFTIMNEYEGGRLKLYHYDAYRLANGAEAEQAGLAEYFGAKGSVCLIEWYSNIADILGRIKTIKIEIKYTGENLREININDK